MSYRRAWQLVDSMNRCFKEPLVQTAVGGKSGGGAIVTELGKEIAERYRKIEKAALKASAGNIDLLTLHLR
jgi:molybdate transport system regulatory protein